MVLLSVTPIVLFVKTTSMNLNHFLATLRVPSTRALAISLATLLMLFISFLAGYVEYVGETKNTLKKHFYGHQSTVKTKKLDTPVGQHFNLPNHSISDMILQGIESLGHRKDSVRLSREKVWMKRLRTVEPHGLNIQQGND